MSNHQKETDIRFMRRALQLAKRGYGKVSPNPMVGAVLVSHHEIIGEGWHQKAGSPHAEINALEDAKKKGHATHLSTLYVSLEPCSTTGRTPPCTDAIMRSSIQRVVIACEDPNPAHAGKGVKILEDKGLEVVTEVLRDKARGLNQNFFHWICQGRPRVTIKAAMTLDGKIATSSGQSKWITGSGARKHAMKLRYGMDAMLVGIETVIADDPSLTVRLGSGTKPSKKCLRIVLDSKARTPINSKLLTDEWNDWTRIVVSESAPAKRVDDIQAKAQVWVSPNEGRIDLGWLLDRMGKEGVTSLLVEGGGEVNAAFLQQNLAQEAVFYYAPKILGGNHARRGIAGSGARSLEEATRLTNTKWKQVGDDLVMKAEIMTSF